ncbi:MAG: GNAT family protein [Nocardioidaceae bacterium]
MAINEYGQPVGDPVDWSPAAYPPHTMLTGTHVTLEPLAIGHAADLFAALNQPGHESDWTYLPEEPFTDAAEFRSFIDRMIADDGLLAFAAVVGGRALGFGSLMRIQPALGTIELGWLHFGPDLRGTPAAREAFQLWEDHVFALGYRRYEWKCDALNERSRRAAERLGFSYEGTWRNALVYKGRNRDTAWFAMTASSRLGSQSARMRLR